MFNPASHHIRTLTLFTWEYLLSGLVGKVQLFLLPVQLQSNTNILLRGPLALAVRVGSTALHLTLRLEYNPGATSGAS